MLLNIALKQSLIYWLSNYQTEKNKKILNIYFNYLLQIAQLLNRNQKISNQISNVHPKRRANWNGEMI